MIRVIFFFVVVLLVVLPAAVIIGCASANAQTFSPIITGTVALGRMNHVFAVADLNGDGLDDIVVGDQIDHDPDFTSADRLAKVPLHVFTSDGDGTFTLAPALVDGQIEAHAAVVVVGDFNGDARNDLVVYDHGAYVDSASSGYGNPPQLFLSSDDGVLRSCCCPRGTIWRSSSMRLPAVTA